MTGGGALMTGGAVCDYWGRLLFQGDFVQVGRCGVLGSFLYAYNGDGYVLLSDGLLVVHPCCELRSWEVKR